MYPRTALRTLNVMLGGSVAVLAGTVSTVLFAVSTLPMLVKAARTKDLTSYSRGNMVLANVGNAVHSIYVFQLPAGPIWALHAFYLVSSALMLYWHLRFARPARTAARSIGPAAADTSSARPEPCTTATGPPTSVMSAG
jgi:uncharacterized protein with PQ loop repeat